MNSKKIKQSNYIILCFVYFFYIYILIIFRFMGKRDTTIERRNKLIKRNEYIKIIISRNSEP